MSLLSNASSVPSLTERPTVYLPCAGARQIGTPDPMEFTVQQERERRKKQFKCNECHEEERGPASGTVFSFRFSGFAAEMEFELVSTG